MNDNVILVLSKIEAKLLFQVLERCAKYNQSLLSSQAEKQAVGVAYGDLSHVLSYSNPYQPIAQAAR